MSHLRQRIDLIHELRQLAAAEEITDHCRKCFRIDQLIRGHVIRCLIKDRHALFHQALCASQTDAALIGQQLTHRSHTAAAQMIDIIHTTMSGAESQQITSRVHHIIRHHDAHIFTAVFQVQFLFQFVTAHTT